MATDDSHSALTTVWDAQRGFIVELGRALHSLLTAENGQIVLHGRDLRPTDEGIGAQLQYRLNDQSDGPGHACFVLDIALTRGRTSLLWVINAVSVESVGNNDYAITGRQSFTVPVMQRSRLRELFATDLTRIATAFLCLERPSMTAGIS